MLSSSAEYMVETLHLAEQSYRMGRLEEAMGACAEVLRCDPNNAKALHLLGAVLHGQGKREEAIRCFERALSSDPGHAEAYFRLGNALRESNRLPEAIGVYQRALSVNPRYGEVLNNLGTLYQSLGRWDEAMSFFDRAIAAVPGFAEAHYNRGNVLGQLEKLEEAVESYRRALEIKPDLAEALNNMGGALVRQNRLEQAIDAFERAVFCAPSYVDAYLNLGACLERLGNTDRAIGFYKQAVATWPDSAQACYSLGNAMHKANRLEEAIAAYQRALAVNPRYAEALNNLGKAFQELGRWKEAIACFDRAIAIVPSFVGARFNRANVVYGALTRMEEIIDKYEELLAIRPDIVEAHSNLIMVKDFGAAFGTADQQAERRQWYEKHGRAFAGSIRPHGNVPDPERRLRIGYVSADFYDHSACYIFGPVIINHDRSLFEVVCYSGGTLEDRITDTLRGAAGAWRSTVGLPDDKLAELVREDGIDILVDLSGHTSGNRLLVFARKPAPVQVTAWGHANGTGVETIDYLFADPIAVPPELRVHFTEEIIDLPCILLFGEPEGAPGISALPSLSDRPFTFASANRLEKMSDRALASWGRILAQVPRSRLIVKDRVLDGSEAREILLGRLEKHGIERQRVCLLGKTPRTKHLETYQEVDMALDPFPMTGGLSTAEALWMGVPVVTLLGSTLPSRGSASMLTALGMEEWIARREEDYVRIAVEMAGKPQVLSALRAELRRRVAKSGFGDVVGYVRAVEGAYRQMWRRWCRERASP